MPRFNGRDDDYDEDWGDPDDEDADLEGEVDEPDPDDCYIACPNCGMDVYDEAALCPYCSEVLVGGSTNYLSDKPTWYVYLAVAGIIAVILSVLMAV